MEASRQIKQMVDFIKLEAREKALEIRTKVRVGRRAASAVRAVPIAFFVGGLALTRERADGAGLQPGEADACHQRELEDEAGVRSQEEGAAGSNAHVSGKGRALPRNPSRPAVRQPRANLRLTLRCISIALSLLAVRRRRASASTAVASSSRVTS
jgi:hypothetical protein